MNSAGPGSTAASSQVAAAYVQEAMHWSPAAAQADPLPHPAEPAATFPGNARPRILWADDNTDMRDYVARLLSPAYEVIGGARWPGRARSSPHRTA